MGMCYESDIAATLICIIGINYLVNIFLCIVNSGKILAFKVDEIHSVIEFTVEKCSVILVKKVGFCNIQKKFKIPYQILNGMIYGAKISALENLAATSDAQTLGITLIVGL